MQLSNLFQPKLAPPTPQEPVNTNSKLSVISSRNVRLPNATSGGGAIAKSEDGQRCAVVGKDSLRILTLIDTSDKTSADRKCTIVGRGGYGIETTKNLFAGSTSTLKYDNIFTDVMWGRSNYNHKILTGTRNGELIMWDLQRSMSKFERRAKDHTRSINKVAYSPIIPHYCCTGSSDGNLRLWDIREMSKSVLHVHHNVPIRTLIMSASPSSPLNVIAGLDNGTLCRWDLKNGQKGKCGRVPVAHSGVIMDLDWCVPRHSNNPGGWLASAGLDQTVKVWEITNEKELPRAPMYTLHTPYPVRRVCWRPGHETEVAVAYDRGFSFGAESAKSTVERPGLSGLRTPSNSPVISHMSLAHSRGASMTDNEVSCSAQNLIDAKLSTLADAIQIWDVRQAWIAKWSVKGSSVENGVTDVTFADSQALWTQHTSGAFSQIDLRHSMSMRPIDSVPRTALSWGPTGALAFISDKPNHREVPYDDVSSEYPNSLPFEIEGSPMHSLKKLGTNVHVPVSQHIGICVPKGVAGSDDFDMVTFQRLASGYKIDGTDRVKLCEENAEIAFTAGHEDAAQMWLLLQSLLPDVDSKPPTPKLSPLHSNSRLPRATASTSSINGNSPARVPSKEARSKTPSGLSKLSPLRREDDSRSGKLSSRGNSAGPSPSLSPSSPLLSPQYIPLDNGSRASPSTVHSTGPLDANVTPTAHRFKSRRQASVSILSSSVRTTPSRASNSMKTRRASVSIYTPVRKEGYVEPGRSPSLRHIGEGALDDSDSSEGSMGRLREGLAFGNASSDFGDKFMTSLPRAVDNNSSPQAKQPKPRTFSLSTVSTDAEEEVEGDNERDEMTVSPGSSETDSDGASVASTRPRRSSSLKHKSRSHSSETRTHVSNSKNLTSVKATVLPRLESGSSIQTIVAAYQDANEGFIVPENPGSAQRHVSIQEQGQRQESRSSGRGIEHSVDRSSTSQNGATRAKRQSQAFSINSAVIVLPEFEEESEESPVDECEIRFLRWNDHAIRDAEAECRQIGWVTLQERVEELAEQGDVQMCALLSCIAGAELGIKPWRKRQFLESYIDLLSRFRLHTVAAYMRKYAVGTEVGQVTQQHTTLYTICPKCCKPIINPVVRKKDGSNTIEYGHCMRCKQATIKCTICRLPVRSAMFVCAVCSHGGHQECYRQYYLQRPMTELLTTTNDRGRSPSRGTSPVSKSREGFLDPDMSGLNDSSVTGTGLGQVVVKVMGQPCAAGCGHYCWTSTEKFGTA